MSRRSRTSPAPSGSRTATLPRSPYPTPSDGPVNSGPGTERAARVAAPRGFRWLAYVTVGATYLLIVMGAIVRASGSGLGCPDWPLCYGHVVPPGHAPGVIEYSHRVMGGITGLLILSTVVMWARSHRFRPRVVAAGVGILLLLALQVGLGALVVNFELPPMLVLVHLGMAMLLFALLIGIAVGASGSAVGPPASRRFLRLAVAATVAVYVLMLTGAYVRASGASWACTGFPTCNGDWLPFGAGRLVDIQLLHRLLAYAVAAHLVITMARAWRAERQVPALRPSAAVVGLCLLAQISIGASAVSTGVPPLLQVLHVAGAAALWGSTVTLLALTLRSRRVQVVGDGPHPSSPPLQELGEGGERPVLAVPDVVSSRTLAEPANDRQHALAQDWERGPGDEGYPFPSSTRARLNAFVALTKPRIIVLLLVTTVGGMVLAADGLPPLHLVLLTLLGGTLGAGGANAINHYLDRDIDGVMRRTVVRPIPAGLVSPTHALRFGLLLALASFLIFALFVNVLSAVLTLGALAFYVFVYTRWLKRSSVHNIVIGGAAGAVPPLVGWAAVRGEISLLAVFLFAIIFYWTPPHFWALSLLIKQEYARAGVPMLPVVRGDDETRQQILLYAILLVALSALIYAVGLLGPLYVAAALALGGIFIVDATRLVKEATSEAARRLFKFSILYLTLLFAAMVIDHQIFRI